MTTKTKTLREFYPLTGAKAMELWPKIFPFINDALAPANGDLDGRKERIQKSLLNESLTLWLGLKDKEFDVIITTTENTDPHSGEKSLLIYSMVIQEAISPVDLRVGLDKLKAYAKSRGLPKITALTNLEMLRTLFEKAGGHTTFTLDLEV